ncbi:hypothetical protein [Trinickia fusca]|uniref:Uncharacterized protein n=1 Tax=Trinickia fusca TaxID=2419777 RepID=A0A494WZE9_9BURK|nr:hypothetical protein [Trinickia fusca]RKP43422.1 hypothetical protein D7S89_26105 [Trinickia fusca]
MNVSHPIPGDPLRRVYHLFEARHHALEPRAARRLNIALMCLGVSYALAWLEIPLSFAMSPPGDASMAGDSPLVAAITACVLLGALYTFVALCYAWARWLTVVMSLLSVVFVGPLLPAEWQTFALGALVTSTGLAAKFAAALLLIAPLHKRRDGR